MVKQGEIIMINFNPQKGFEQAGYRPAVVMSNDKFNAVSNVVMICPVTNTKRKHPLYVALDSRTATTGVIMCDNARAMDIAARGYRSVEMLPDDLLEQSLKNIFAVLDRGEGS